MRNTFSFLMRHINSVVKTAYQDVVKNYEEAVRTLNTLQSNAAVIDKIKKERVDNRHLVHTQTVEFANRAGLTLDDLDKLSVIHVSGTKGKGSTCAYCESILRSHGLKTGFFSSPHLVEVRERIRINGRPIGKDAFSSYFWDCYKALDNTKADHGDQMPAYFRFLTIMAFHVFLKEKVDVAIIEVGIGGQYDCTNILRSPVVCGVSSLGMDHMSILGDTIDSIAWNKGGIFKPNVPAFTVAQPDNSLQVLIDRAKEIGNPLWLVPPLDEYHWDGEPVRLGIQGKMQKVNASLAMQMCQVWLKDHDKSIKERQSQYKDLGIPETNTITISPPLTINKNYATGLEQCHWPGRNQTIKKPGLTYYIDGAHTPRSIEQCMEWFQEVSTAESSKMSGKVVRVLVFNATGDRRPETLLKVVQYGQFDCAAFCPNIATASTRNADQTNYTITIESQLSRCHANRSTWIRLHSPSPELQTNVNFTKDNTDSAGAAAMPNGLDSEVSESLLESQSFSESSGTSESKSELKPESSDLTTHGVSPKPEVTDRIIDPPNLETAQMFSSIQDALLWAGQGRDSTLATTDTKNVVVPPVLANADHIQVLCTGSLHLIGGVIKLVAPNVND